MQATFPPTQDGDAILNYQTYLFFDGRTEYIQGYDTPQHTYPLGSLVFGLLDMELASYLEQATVLLDRFQDADFPAGRTMAQSLAEPETCAYHQAASFYHGLAEAVRATSPGLFDLLEGYCSATFRRFKRELDRVTGQLSQANQGQASGSRLSTNELFQRAIHTGNLALTSDLLEGYCRSFPDYTEQMQAFIQWDTPDASLCDTALLFLESFADLLRQLTQAEEDFRSLIAATLVSENGRPWTEQGQRPAELLVALADQDDPVFLKYQELEDTVHIQTLYKLPTGNKKSGISAATFYASDTLPALLFLEFVQMCSQNLPVAVCESCHRLFVPFSSRAKYCERVLDPETGATCKDIAAKLAYAEELKADKAKELYNKMRNRYQMRCARAPGNQKMRDAYNAWRKQAQMALSKYQLGEIGWEEFKEIAQGKL